MTQTLEKAVDGALRLWLDGHDWTIREPDLPAVRAAVLAAIGEPVGDLAREEVTRLGDRARTLPDAATAHLGVGHRRFVQAAQDLADHVVDEVASGLADPGWLA